MIPIGIFLVAKRSQVLHTSWAEVSVQMRAHHRRVVLNSEEILAEMIGVHRFA